jgi:hypothetical protein
VITTASPAIRCPIASLPQCPAAVAAYGKPTYQLEALRAHLHDSATLPSIADDALATMELIDTRHRARGSNPAHGHRGCNRPGLTAGQLKHTKRALNWTPRQ